MKFSSFKELAQPQAKPHDASWEIFATRLLRDKPFLGEHRHPGWSPATFDPPLRAKENVVEVSCISLDYDGGETLEDTLPRFAQYQGLYHTTRNHQVEKDGKITDRFRIVLLLNRPVTADEYYRLWKAFALEAGHVDEAPKDPSRFWYAPGSKDGTHFKSGLFTGSPLHVDNWLLREPAPAPPKAANDVRSRSYLKMEDSPFMQARAALSKMPLSLSDGEGNANLYSASLRVASFGLDGDQVLSLMREFNGACQPPWEDKEVMRSVMNAIRYVETMAEIESVPEVEPPASPQVADLRDDPRFVSKRTSFARVFARLTDPAKPAPLSTGHSWLDAALGGGYPRGKVTIVGGHTSLGKSWMAILGQEANPDNSIIITCEDDDEDFSVRSMAVKSDIQNIRLNGYSDLTGDELSSLAAVASRQSESPWVYNAQGESAEHVAAIIRALPGIGVNLVFMDYLQVCLPRGGDAPERTMVNRALKILTDAAKISGVTLVLFSQFSRQDIKDEPKLSWFKESGDIENYASVALLGGFVGGRRESNARYFKVGKFKGGKVTNEKFYLCIDTRTGGFIPMESEPVPTHSEFVANTHSYSGKLQ